MHYTPVFWHGGNKLMLRDKPQREQGMCPGLCGIRTILPDPVQIRASQLEGQWKAAAVGHKRWDLGLGSEHGAPLPHKLCRLYGAMLHYCPWAAPLCESNFVHGFLACLLIRCISSISLCGTTSCNGCTVIRWYQDGDHLLSPLFVMSSVTQSETCEFSEGTW